MSQAGSNRRKSISEAEPQERPDIDQSVRKFAVASTEPAIAAWEQSADGRNSGWKQATWFWLRELKRHPAFAGKEPLAVAKAVEALFNTEPTIRGMLEGDGYGESDVMTFVQMRWGGISTAAGENPLHAAGRIATSQEIRWKIPERLAVEFGRFCYGAESESEAKDHWLRRAKDRTFSAWWHELGNNPLGGKFYATLWMLRQTLRSPEEGKEPVLILPCVGLGETLGCDQRTAWDWRIRAEKAKALIKLPKVHAKHADHYRLADVFPVWLQGLRMQFESSSRSPKDAIDLD